MCEIFATAACSFTMAAKSTGQLLGIILPRGIGSIILWRKELSKVTQFLARAELYRATKGFISRKRGIGPCNESLSATHYLRSPFSVRRARLARTVVRTFSLAALQQWPSTEGYSLMRLQNQERRVRNLIVAAGGKSPKCVADEREEHELRPGSRHII